MDHEEALLAELDDEEGADLRMHYVACEGCGVPWPRDDPSIYETGRCYGCNESAIMSGRRQEPAKEAR